MSEIKAPSTETAPNIGNPYEIAWKTLFEQLTPEIKAKVLYAKGSNTIAPPEVVEFIKHVIAMAEQEK
jgi:hypothetical protein